MSKEQDRTVYFNGSKWANVRKGSRRASSLHDTQKEAIDQATRMLKNQGGGELTIKGKADGKIRSKDTIAPGRDPNPPRDTEH